MIRYLLLSTSVALAGCSSNAPADTTPQDPVALVSLTRASTGGVAETQTLYGAIELGADNQFTLSAPAEATVASLIRPAGSAVSRGQAVIALKASPTTQATYAQYAAVARSAQQAYERAKRLRADGLVSDAEVESARAAAAGAAAQARALSAQTAGLVLRSPGAGYVQSIAVNPGDLVAAGATVATIARAGDLRAKFGIDPVLVSKLSRGKGISIARAGGGSAVTVPIASVDPSADPQTRLASIYVRVPAGLGIGAGQTLTGQVTLAQSDAGVTIPYPALLDEGGQPYVYVVDKGVAHRRDVVAGASDGKSVAITSGVKASELVVTAGGTALEDGMKVRPK